MNEPQSNFLNIYNEKLYCLILFFNKKEILPNRQDKVYFILFQVVFRI